MPEIVPDIGRRARIITRSDADLLVVLTAESPLGKVCLVNAKPGTPQLVRVLAEPRPGFYILDDCKGTLIPAAYLSGVVRVLIQEFDHDA